MVLLPVFIRNVNIHHLYLYKMKFPKAMVAINRLMAESRESHKEAAWAFFNKCDYRDLIDKKICLVDMARRNSFLEYANSKGIHPCGGAFTNDMKAQYFYI